MTLTSEPLQISFTVNNSLISHLHGNETLVYPTKNGTMKYKYSLTTEQIYYSNIRFRNIVEQKLQTMPVNVQDFLDVLEKTAKIDLRISKQQQLTKKRLQDIVSTINEAIIGKKVNQFGRNW